MIPDIKKVIGNNILLKRHEKVTKLTSLLFAPETAYYDNEFCDVLAVGSDKSIEVKPGEVVMVRSFDGDYIDKVKYPGVFWAKPSDIICVVEKCINENYNIDTTESKE